MDISFKIRPNDNHYHKDFIIKIDDQEEIADTYYFWKDEYGDMKNPYDGIFTSVSEYLSKWRERIKNMDFTEEIFVPIDLSDEYVGGFKVKRSNERLEIMYGYIYDIYPLIIRVDSSRIVTNLDNKEIDLLITFEMGLSDFLNKLYLT